MIGLDNASNPQGGLGDEQLAWFDKEVTKVPATSRLIVFAHRPLFPLQQNWDWFTGDGEKALAILEKHPGTTVFYGHIHQTNLAKTGATTHASVRGLAFPLPAPGSVPEKKPLPWDPTPSITSSATAGSCSRPARRCGSIVRSWANWGRANS